MGPAFSPQGRHPPFKTAPVADSQRSHDPLFKTSVRADSQRWRPLHPSVFKATGPWVAPQPLPTMRAALAS